jgi:hypothetical protein
VTGLLLFDNKTNLDPAFYVIAVGNGTNIKGNPSGIGFVFFSEMQTLISVEPLILM